MQLQKTITTTLTHWGRDKMAAISKCIFLHENVWISNKKSLKFVPNWQYSSTGSEIGLAPTMRQAIIWTDGG